MAQQQRQRGRPSKGHRVEMTTRVRPEIHAAAKALARARGTTVNAFVEGVLERELGTLVEIQVASVRDVTRVA